MGHDEGVRAAAEAFLARAQLDWDTATPTQRFPRPAVGTVRFHFLGAYEIRVYETDEQRLRDRVDPLTELYLTAHAVLSEIHVIELGLPR